MDHVGSTPPTPSNTASLALTYGTSSHKKTVWSWRKHKGMPPPMSNDAHTLYHAIDAVCCHTRNSPLPLPLHTPRHHFRGRPLFPLVSHLQFDPPSEKDGDDSVQGTAKPVPAMATAGIPFVNCHHKSRAVHPPR
mmetsp:Transcript_20996/g.44947  ORF Transcript_20996/g.44947 Transcript_20996/m.44947 type:complete len:135 (-) Transcript_20996:351-755(-)